MKKFLKNISLFSIATIGVFVLMIIVSKKILRDGNYFTVKPNITTLILGHSQTECGINDSLIVNTRNISQGGESYFYTYQKLKKLVKDNDNINTVILSFSNNQIDKVMDKWTWGEINMENNYPKYSFMMNSEDYLLLANNNSSALLTSEPISIKKFFVFIFGKNKDFLSNRNCGGYLYLKRNKIDSLLKTDYLEKKLKLDYSTISKTNILYCEKIVSFCNENNIKLFFIRTPLHPKLPILKNQTLYDNIKNKDFKSVPLLDFKDFPTEIANYGDFDHLNHSGATVFSKFLNELILKGLLNSKNPQEMINTEMNSLKAEKKSN